MRSLIALIYVALSAACIPSVSLEGRPCPCAEGYQCCEGVCLVEGETCSALSGDDGGATGPTDGGIVHDGGDGDGDGDGESDEDGGTVEMPADGGASAAKYVKVGCGGNHTCMLDDSGAMFCLGGFDQGQTEYPSEFVFAEVDLGYRHSCGLTVEGFGVCFGAGEINAGTNLNSGQSIPPNDRLIAISAGKYHTCGLTEADGAVLCWGDFEHDLPAGSFAKMSSGVWHTCVLDDEGAATCFGSSVSASSPPLEGRYSAIAAGNNITCAADKETGELSCFGSFTDYGVQDVPAGTYQALALGAFHGCALATDGSIACWGAGQNPALTNTSPHYGQADPPEGTFVALSAGDFHTCAVTAEGAVMCWGMNINGQSPESLTP